MEILNKLNSPVMYMICAGAVLFVALLCVIFAVRAYRAGKAIGMDPAMMKTAIIASASFAALPSVAILLGVIALSGSLGTPWPWLRLSVVGALHYETQVAQAAAEAVGIGGLSASNMTAEAFTTIAFLMSLCIIWGIALTAFTCRRYTKILGTGTVLQSARSAPGENGNRIRKRIGPDLWEFSDRAMTAMFIGMVSAYIGSYVGTFVSGNGKLAFSGSWLPLAVAACASAAMALLLWIREKKKAEWIDSFSIAASMLIAMAAAVVLAKFA